MVYRLRIHLILFFVVLIYSTQIHAATPKIVFGFYGSPVVLALSEKGEVWSWGSQGLGREVSAQSERFVADKVLKANHEPLTDVIDIAAGAGFGIALTADGKVWAWGKNAEGQLGAGSTTFTSRTLAAPVYRRSSSGLVHLLTNIKALAAAPETAFALANSGEVYAWGRNGENILLGNNNGGLGTMSDTAVVVKMTRPGPVIVDTGGGFSIASGRGEMAFFGTRFFGQDFLYGWGAVGGHMLGQFAGNTVPVAEPVTITGFAIPFDVRCEKLAVGWSTAYCISPEGHLWEWGNRTYPFHGYDMYHRDKDALNRPLLLNQIDAGINHVIALKKEGGVITWGSDDSTALGYKTPNNGTVYTVDAPARYDSNSSPLKGFIDVAASDKNSAAIRNDGTVWTWGSNSAGQLGIGTKGGSRNGAVQVKMKNGQPLYLIESPVCMPVKAKNNKVVIICL